ncbi:aldo/keto reductase [Actinomycetospora cinnamomea]|uniref:Diketogulonate reductase-like aldo/keto reductase n=1 Tax=Actinomycetospora cinnamomea TaxID=663609 RepID=A0A2U1FG72_9PSEU|nr:aldo/keto reductase [Actinomycetospora cinnamomea]PVZ10970.1 diketogulonate reductase-like aldo/keto reductase [Actinomycetospora cinnamomea]
MSDVPDIELNNGTKIPQLGFGVFQIDPADTADAVTNALEVGYRHIDTAQMYGNEAEVGEAIAKSGIPRDELWITTKCNNSNHGYDDAQSALDESLQKMGLDHVDLYLIHWPLPGKDLYVETWKGFEQAQRDGRTRAIGVSNFQPHHLDRLLAETETVPAVNQIELHPHMQQAGLRSYHERHGIHTEAWSPIGQGKGLLDAPELAEIAQAHGKSAAQVVLRWHLQLGNIVFPKSSTAERMRENFDIFDFELTVAEMGRIEGMEKAERLGPDPDKFDR